MTNAAAQLFRPGMERLEQRDVPAFLSPIWSPMGGGLRAEG